MTDLSHFLSVGDNVRIVDDGISKNSVLRLLSSVGLERDVYDLFPEELSGGMKKTRSHRPCCRF